MSATRNPALLRPLLATVLGILVLPACSAPTAPRSAAVPAPPTTSAAAATTPRPTTPPPLPEPADGSDTDACGDGTCEVRVGVGGRIPFPRRTDVVARVTAIDDGLVELTGTWPGGHIESTGNCRSACSASMSFPTGDAPGSFEVRITAGGGVEVNEYVLEVVAVGADEAVVRLRPV